jgi:hypothetical protein
MATVNVTAYGAVANDETFDNGPAFFNAAKAAKVNGTVILPIGMWHLRSFPTWTGAFPKVTADPNAFINYHLTCDYFGTVTVAALQSFVIYHAGLGVPYYWTLEGLGVRA